MCFFTPQGLDANPQDATDAQTLLRRPSAKKVDLASFDAPPFDESDNEIDEEDRRRTRTEEGKAGEILALFVAC